MSSINKSGKRFTPKIKQRARHVSAVVTPQSSQVPPKGAEPEAHLQTPASTQAPAQPLSPISQKVPAVPKAQTDNLDNARTEIDSEDEKLSDLDELKEDQTVGNVENIGYNNNGGNGIFKTSGIFTENKENAKTSNDSPKTIQETGKETLRAKSVAPTERRDSSHRFTQPTVHRARLNSLSIPTPLPGYASNPRDGTINSNSRRGSVIASNLTPGSSRRGSVISTGINVGLGPVTINPGSRRGSVNALRPAFGVNGDRSRRGSVSTINTERLGGLNDEKSIPIPIMRSNKKRRISVNVGSKKAKDVSVGGISIGGAVVPVRNTFGSDAERNGFKEKDNSDLNIGGEIQSEINIATDKNGKETGADDASERQGKSRGVETDMNNTPNDADTKDNDNPEPIKFTKLDLTEEEMKLEKKWILNRETKKYELVDTKEFHDDVTRQQEFMVEHEIESLSELTKLRKNDNMAVLGNSLKFNSRKIKMKDLCKPFLPVGQLSKNYENAMEGERKIEEAKKKRMELREKARSLRLSESDVLKLTNNGEALVEMSERERMLKVKELMEKDRGEGSKKHNVPKLQIQDGKVTYSHESTVVDRHEETSVEMERVEENPFENIVTSSSYSKRNVTLKWTPQEVAELLRAISLWGTDFGLIAQLFPHRTRKQIKSKFLLEEKTHPHLVEFALLRKLPVDIREYSGKTGKEFKTLDEYNKQIADLKIKHEKELKMMELAREQAQAEDRANQHNMYQSQQAGAPTRRSRKAVIAEFRRNEEIVGTIDNNKQG